MKFKDKDIVHIAELARLDLSSQELKAYRSQLSDITSYIDQIAKIDLSNYQEKAESKLHNVWREDKVEDWLQEEKLAALEQGERKQGLIKVKRVL